MMNDLFLALLYFHAEGVVTGGEDRARGKIWLSYNMTIAKG